MFGFGGQSSKYASQKMAPENPFPTLKRPSAIGTIPRMLKGVWNNGLFGDSPVPHLRGGEYRLDAPASAFRMPAQTAQSFPAYQPAMGSPVAGEVNGAPATMGGPVDHGYNRIDGDYSISRSLPGFLGGDPNADVAFVGALPGEKAIEWGSVGAQLAQPDPQTMALLQSPGLQAMTPQMDTSMQVEPMQRRVPQFDYSGLVSDVIPEATGGVPMPAGPAVDMSMLPQVRPMVRGDMNSMALVGGQGGDTGAVGRLMMNTFDGLNRNSGYEGELLDAAMRGVRNTRGNLMDAAASPLAQIAGAFLPPGAARQLGQYAASVGGRAQDRMGNTWNMITMADKRAMDRGKFANDYAMNWDPNSPQNQKQAFEQEVARAKAYADLQGASTGAYNAQSTRQNNLESQAEAQRQGLFNQEKFNAGQRQLNYENMTAADQRKYERQQNKYKQQYQQWQDQNALRQQAWQHKMDADKFEFEKQKFEQAAQESTNKYERDQMNERAKMMSDAAKNKMDLINNLVKMGTPKNSTMDPEILNKGLAAFGLLRQETENEPKKDWFGRPTGEYEEKQKYIPQVPPWLEQTGMMPPSQQAPASMGPPPAVQQQAQAMVQQLKAQGMDPAQIKMVIRQRFGVQ